MKHWHKFPYIGLRKRISVWLLLALFAMAASPLGAADDKKNPKESKENLTTLQQLLKMPKEDLKRVRLTLESIEKMSPANKFPA